MLADDLASIVATAHRPRKKGRGMESVETAARRGTVAVAIAGLAFHGGLRRSEIAALRGGDAALRELIAGIGPDERIVPLTGQQVARRLEAAGRAAGLDRRRDAGRRVEDGAHGRALRKTVKMTVEHLIVGLLGAILTAGVALGLRLDTKIDRANDRIDDAVKDLKEDARIAHAEIGTNIRRVDENVKASEKRVTDNFNARFDDLRDYIKLAMKTVDKD